MDFVFWVGDYERKREELVDVEFHYICY